MSVHAENNHTIYKCLRCGKYYPDDIFHICENDKDEIIGPIHTKDVKNMSVHDETCDRPICNYCKQEICYGENSCHYNGKCIEQRAASVVIDAYDKEGWLKDTLEDVKKQNNMNAREKLKGVTIPVLDKGFVRLIDFYGDDRRICETARISYKSPSKGDEQDKKLLFYLYRMRHTSPFEHCVITFNVKLPLFVQGQMVRHRTQRINQISSRYSEMVDDFYIPTEWRKQDTKNKQGSVVDDNWNDRWYVDGWSKNKDFSAILKNNCIASYKVYKEMLIDGVSREMARMILPQNLYTEIYSQWDLHNLMHFFTLRLSEHAQFEIRVYAQAMYDIFKQLYPWCSEAYEKYKYKMVEI